MKQLSSIDVVRPRGKLGRGSVRKVWDNVDTHPVDGGHSVNRLIALWRGKGRPSASLTTVAQSCLRRLKSCSIIHRVKANDNEVTDFNNESASLQSIISNPTSTSIVFHGRGACRANCLMWDDVCV